MIHKQQINQQARFYNTLYFQPGLADSADYRLLDQASLLIKLDEKFDWKVNLEISFDSRPPQTVKDKDVVYSTGFEYSF